MDLLARTCDVDRMNISRLFARGFVIAGGLIWFLMFAAAETAQRYSDLAYTLSDVGNAVVSAIVPAVVAIALFVLGLFYERLTATLLFAASAAVVIYGIIIGWSAILWVSVLALLVAPMLLAGVLFILAARTQDACTMEANA